jgi:hypothetical protein
MHETYIMRHNVFGLALALFMITETLAIQPSTAAAAAATTTTTTTMEKPISRFREKYLEQIYNDHYHYTLNRRSLEDNDYDMCPDYHKSATIFSITGQQINRIIRTCSVYVERKPANDIQYSPHESHYTILAQITVMDVIQFTSAFICYTFEIGMYIMSIILLCCSTILIGIGILCS